MVYDELLRLARDARSYGKTYVAVLAAAVEALVLENRRMREALEQIVVHCGMSRSQFVAQGPAFAIAQVERAVITARQALETTND